MADSQGVDASSGATGRPTRGARSIDGYTCAAQLVFGMSATFLIPCPKAEGQW